MGSSWAKFDIRVVSCGLYSAEWKLLERSAVFDCDVFTSSIKFVSVQACQHIYAYFTYSVSDFLHLASQVEPLDKYRFQRSSMESRALIPVLRVDQGHGMKA